MSEEKIDDKTNVERRSDWRGLGLLFLVMIVVIAAGAAGYLQFATVNQPLTQQVAALHQQAMRDQENLTALQRSVAVLEQGAQQTQSLSERQAQVMAEWQAAQKGNLDRWYVAEAQYLVKLADEQLQFTQNVSSALTLLQRADQILQNVQDDRLVELRKSLTADIAKLQAAPQTDIGAIYTHLTNLNNQLDQLPIPASPLKQETKQAEPVISPEDPWWKRGLAHSWYVLKQLVVVQYNGTNTLPLVMPEERPFLYQNLHLQLESAKWAVLNRNAEVYQASLTQAIMWTHQFFVLSSPVTKTFLQNLDALRRVTIQPPAMNLSATLQHFNSYLSQPAAAAPAAVS